MANPCDGSSGPVGGLNLNSVPDGVVIISLIGLKLVFPE